MYKRQVWYPLAANPALKAVTVYGNGEQTRDFVYAGDVAAAIKAGLAARGYQTINVRCV